MRVRSIGANGVDNLRACHYCGKSTALYVAHRPYQSNREYMACVKCMNCGLTLEPPYTYDSADEAITEVIKLWNSDSKREQETDSSAGSE